VKVAAGDGDVTKNDMKIFKSAAYNHFRIICGGYKNDAMQRGVPEMLWGHQWNLCGPL
jgi:hypothetical protein